MDEKIISVGKLWQCKSNNTSQSSHAACSGDILQQF